MKTDTSTRLSAIRKLMKDGKYVRQPLSAYIVPSGDAHDSEYLAEVDMRRQYVSGFTGSAGTALITQDKALLWTDGRYFLQALKEMDTNWMLMKDRLPETPSRGEWLVENLEPGSFVGADPMLVSRTAWNDLKDQLEDGGHQLVAVEQNLVDVVWEADREDTKPARPENKVFPLEHEFTGRTWQSKVEEVRAQLKEKKSSAIVLSALDDVAWLLNLRGSDIDYNPVFFSYCVVTLKEVVLFLNPNQVNPSLTDSLTPEDMEESVVIMEYDKIKSYVSGLGKSGGKVWFSNTASQGLVSLVPKQQTLVQVTPVTLMKAIKNKAELKGFINCHIRDSAALCQYFCWIQKNIGSGQVTEISGADALENFRKEQQHFMGLSFPSISGSGPNGAIIHYRPQPDTDRRITSEEMYLIDSGAQYKDGTTDVTRTLHFGTPSTYQKECFTRVLKGMIGLAGCVFPDKCKGYRLDTLARIHLWKVGLDYLHGTGHGVGSFLNVHEGPSGISSRVNSIDPGVQEGMIFSDEPGYYEDGQFGIRIENLVEVTRASTQYSFNDTKMLTFSAVTVVPIQLKLVDPTLLTQDEIQWLNNYHQTCRDRVGPLLKEMGRQEALDWLIKETQPIG